ncbi:hypothetical protein HPB50_012763 [Hyalomma asiaticum]|uniref:Uncharacterized protein n=1 Tax=Hyalomma asiaticum TaxID=266040 RepID=A0ACB7THA1_HYAAI|nr:hypothetical protein HPB50_012763 [Hyalomma asiaticum]
MVKDSPDEPSLEQLLENRMNGISDAKRCRDPACPGRFGLSQPKNVDADRLLTLEDGTLADSGRTLNVGRAPNRLEGRRSAFVCPAVADSMQESNDKLSTRTPSIVRITGSASIEILVRVGIEKEHGLSRDSNVVVLHDFTPCVDDELEVRRGQIVNVLYQENDWVYPAGRPGPDSAHKKLPRGVDDELLEQASSRGTRSVDSGQQSDAESFGATAVAAATTEHSAPDVHPFFKDPAGRYVVLYTFVARDENDVSVERGELVTVLNHEDPDWFWVLRSDGQE